MAAPAPPLVNDYRNGGFTIGTEFHPGPVLIVGKEGAGFAVDAWHATDPDSVTAADFSPLLEAESRPDLILFGVGAEMRHSHADLRMALAGEGIPLEIQTTPAICRTWNLLLSEGRRVALAAIPPGEAGPP